MTPGEKEELSHSLLGPREFHEEWDGQLGKTGAAGHTREGILIPTRMGDFTRHPKNGFQEEAIKVRKELGEKLKSSHACLSTCKREYTAQATHFTTKIILRWNYSSDSKGNPTNEAVSAQQASLCHFKIAADTLILNRAEEIWIIYFLLL